MLSSVSSRIVSLHATVEPRRCMGRYVSYFDLNFKSRIILLYIQCKKNAWLDIQSFDIFSPSMSILGPNKTSHVKIDAWLEVNFATLISRI